MDSENSPTVDVEQLGISSAVEGEATQSAVPVTETGRPHYDKLVGLLANPKVPALDRPRIEAAIAYYDAWIEAMDALQSEGDQRVHDLVGVLNDYKFYVDFELIFNSPENFLYRQSGQLKLSSSVLEEFLPRLADPRVIPSLRGKQYESGPRKSFASAYFMATMVNAPTDVGLQIRTKDQDFTVGQHAYIKASFDSLFEGRNTTYKRIYLAYIAAECKTNLDKTMWQEAVATSHDLRIGLPGSRYFLLCEWLDMPVPSREGTDIHRAFIFRGKRLTANIRSRFAIAQGRSQHREWYAARLKQYPIRADAMLAFVIEMRTIFANSNLSEDEVLGRGYF